MKAIIILLIIASAITLIIFIVKYIRKIKRKRIQQLNSILSIAKQKEAQIYFYLKDNEIKFYDQSTIKKINEFKVGIDVVIKEIEKIDETYSKKKTEEKVDEVIDNAKAKARPYIDLFGLQEETARTFGKLILTTEGLGLKLKFLELLIEMKIRLPYCIFNGILPSFKEDAELIKRCEAFLKAELDFYEKARSVKYFDICIEMRSAIVVSIFESIKSDTINSMVPKFAPFTEAA